ncbi:potassium channel KAT3-like [Folsomia candida]|uniref:potassium channel KAT3-like n=1 Tax=Folsomia candida TaxID=158441 RepID=UPI0016052268|nr:potassium channel KAT3-like [Folsomia candida]
MPTSSKEVKKKTYKYPSSTAWVNQNLRSNQRMASSTTNPPPPGLKPKARRNWNKKGLEAHQKESEDAPPEQPPDAAAERKNWYAIKRIAIPFFIRFLARASLAWEIGLYVIIVLNYGLTTYGCFFTYYNESVWNTVLYTDILYAVDVVMRLSVELWRFNNQAEVLVFTLPYTFFNCFLDLVSLFPSYAIAAQFYDTDSFSHLFWLDYYRLNKFLRLVRAFKFFEVLKVRRLISEEGYFLLTFTNIYLIFINFVSCIFFLFTGLQPVDFLLWRNFTQIDDSWAKEFRKKKPGYGKDPLDFYILSTHFSTATVTTVGYGDVHGENAAEMTACVVIMLIGAILMNGYFTSQITNFQLELDSARYDLFFRLEGILRYMKGIGMSDFFQEKVQLYYKCLWTYREGVDRVTFIEHIPKAVQDDMYYDICLEMFHKSYLFRDLDEAFLRAVSKIVKISMYNPDMILCRYGGYANQMYYILQGECQAMSKHDSSRRAAILRAGTIIGETNLFFSCPYTIAVETNTCCQFISIEKEELMACLNNFPSELSILRSRTQKKINQMYLKFKLFGEDPVCWVQRVTDKKYNKNDMNTAASLSTDMTARWGDEMNLVVTEDVLADADVSICDL